MKSQNDKEQTQKKYKNDIRSKYKNYLCKSKTNEGYNVENFICYKQSF